MVTKEFLEELKKIIEESYSIKLPDKAVERIASFIASYVNLLRNVDANS